MEVNLVWGPYCNMSRHCGTIQESLAQAKQISTVGFLQALAASLPSFGHFLMASCFLPYHLASIAFMAQISSHVVSVAPTSLLACLSHAITVQEVSAVANLHALAVQAGECS